jgi:hypothetical protein
MATSEQVRRRSAVTDFCGLRSISCGAWVWLDSFYIEPRHGTSGKAGYA